MSSFISKSREATEAFACEYAKTLKRGDVVLLDGDMGAGDVLAEATGGGVAGLAGGGWVVPCPLWLRFT